MIVEFKCEKCGRVYAWLFPQEEPKEKCECGGLLKKLFPKGIFRI